MIDGGDVVHEIELAAAPDAVFDMFVDPARLVRWIGISAELEPRPGGLFRFEVEPGQFCEGRFIEVDRPRRVSMTWGWSDAAMGLPAGASRVEVDLTATGTGGTRLGAVSAGGAPGPYPAGDPDARLAELRGDG